MILNKNINYIKSFWVLNVFTAVVRLFTIGRIGLTGDEAHYWTYFQYPNLSYYDHPPAIGYIIGIFTSIFGNNEFAVRLPAVLLFFLLCFLVFKLSKSLFDEKTAFWNIVLLNVIPVFSFIGSVINIPDAPLSVLWMLFIIIFYKLIQENKTVYWYYLGMILGFGLLCKYNAILLVPSAVLFLILSPKNRHWLFKKEPYIASLISLVIFSPVIIWNIQNNWASFGFQMGHGFGHEAPRLSFALLGRAIGSQAGYISPLLFILFWVVLIWLCYKFYRERSEKLLLILAFAFPTLVLFNSVAFFNEILPHWPVMGYLTLSLGTMFFIINYWNKMWFRVFTYSSCSIGIILTILVPLQAIFKIICPEILLPKNEAMRLEDGITRAEKIDITNELYGWHKVGNKINEILSESDPSKTFIFTHRHYIASQLSFYVPNNPRIYCFSDRIDAFDFWQKDINNLEGKDGIFVTNDYFYTDPAKLFVSSFGSWDEPVPVEIYRNNKKIRIFWITKGKSFKPNMLSKNFTSEILKVK
ncbi:glycosyltransferase family 39 protein [Elusimicrobiota bacterium]